MSETLFTVKDDRKTLVIERTFKAPHERVWRAWTDPEAFVKWFGPRGWETRIKHMDFSEGGSVHYGMKCEDPAQTDWYGKVSWGKSIYHGIKPYDTFSYTDAFCDEDGVETPGMPVMDIRVDLIEVSENETRLVSTSVFDSPEALQQVIDMGMKEGLTQTWDRLEELVTSE